MVRAAQTFEVVITQRDFEGHDSAANMKQVRMDALRKAGIRPHPKYLGRVQNVTTRARRNKLIHTMTVVRP